ncbi:MAG: hypothetical protein IT317_13770 [Anaerolineales bacterium]|nr:hypothetical protein [Anaerolineales bacterium]
MAAGDALHIHTGRGAFSNAGVAAAVVESSSRHVRLAWPRHALGDVELTVELSENLPLMRRQVRFIPHLPVALLEIAWETHFATAPSEVLPYDTFWNAPTVAFVRWPGRTLLAGIENPFFRTDCLSDGLRQGFAPGLLLAAGEAYESEAQFISHCLTTGQPVVEVPPRIRFAPLDVHHPRFRNPSGNHALDTAEIAAMRAIADDWLGESIVRQPIRFILYTYWYPLPQPPLDAAGESRWMQVADTFHELGGNLLLFTPLHHAPLPDTTPNAYFDWAPAGSSAERVLQHAQSLGLACGFYSGVAAGNRDYGNSAALPFAPDIAAWKKIDRHGHLSAENCLACDAYAEWFRAVQQNTIDRLGLRSWSWDPGPGHGNFCWSTEHGHLPGQGAYKGWRNSSTIMRRLRAESRGGLFIQGFYGRKEYGLWGLRDSDQHEAYWEQQVEYGASLHPQLASERMNADGVRLQAWWCQNFRFLPPAQNHPLVHRITQQCQEDCRQDQLWDRQAWRYAVLSALAVGNGLTACILPEDAASVPGYAEFLAHWLAWARLHADLIPRQVCFGAQVEIGGVDGYGRIDGDRGVIFLCNPALRPTLARFTLREAGLSVSGPFHLVEFHPRPSVYSLDAASGAVAWSADDPLTVEVPAQEVVVLEVRRDDGHARVFGIGARLAERGSVAELSAVELQPGSVQAFAVRTAADSVLVNGQAIPTTVINGLRGGRLIGAGQPLPRCLDVWHDEAGRRFQFPRHAAYEHLRLRSRFLVNAAVRAHLAAHRPTDPAAVDALVGELHAKGWTDPATWARPDRLWLVLPFTDAQRVGQVVLRVNDQPQPLFAYALHGARVIWYADLSDVLPRDGEVQLELELSDLGANQFSGPYLDLPPRSNTQQIEAAPDETPSRVIFGEILPNPPDLLMARPAGLPPPRIAVITATPLELRAGGQLVLRCRVDQAAADLRGVYASTYGWDHPLDYDAEQDCWILSQDLVPRADIILDTAAVFLWAVARDGTVGERAAVPVEWCFA